MLVARKSEARQLQPNGMGKRKASEASGAPPPTKILKFSGNHVDLTLEQEQLASLRLDEGKLHVAKAKEAPRALKHWRVIVDWMREVREQRL
jgi:hypothetical protein